ncbi:MAG: RNA polymerase sigma factor, partial [Saccharofermentanales bacterium]
SKEDAEDLAQDITLEILKAINSNKPIENFNAFTWSVSNHTFFKWLRSKKHSNTAYLTELYASDDNTEEFIIQKEEQSLLRREIALLSKKYREAIVLHYFDGKTCEEIASIQNKSAGTIKWWLYGARRFIKEGMNKMREYGEKSYKPGTLRMSCQCMPGANDEPMSCVKRKSAQNILLAAYHNPMTTEEFCIELGISAPYVEDDVKYLVDKQLMKEVAVGKWQTDFVILPGQNMQVADKIYEACFPAYYDELMKLLDSKKELLQNDSFNVAGFSWPRLLWVYIHMITDINLCKFKREECKIVMYNDIPDRPNGGKWIALGNENGFPFEPQNKFMNYQPFDGPVHKSGKDFAQGFFHYWSGLDSNVFFDIPDGVFELCRQIIKGEINIDSLDEQQKYLFSIAIEKGLYTNTTEGFKANYYFIRREQFVEIQAIASRFYEVSAVFFKKAYDIVLDEYLKSVPKHLHWQMGNFLSNHLNNFVTCSLFEAFNSGQLSKPDEQNKAWLSLLASE